MRHNWTYKKLTDVCGIQYGFPFDSHCFTDDSSFPPLIRIRDVVRGFSETFYNGDVPEDYYVKAGEYLIGMDGEFNIAPWRSEKALLNQRVCKIYSSDTSTSIHFIYYSLIKLLKQIEAETPSVTVKHLSAKRLNQIELPIPSLDEQRSIVQELDGINHLIDLQEQQLREYDNLAQSLFYSTFGDPLTNPKGWEVKTIGEIGSVERGAGISKKDFVRNGTPCIHYGQLHTSFGAYTTKHLSCISKDLIAKPRIAHHNDVLMAITSEDVEGSCKSTAWMGNYDIVVGSDAAILRHSQNGIYISYYTQTKAFYVEKEKYANGFKVTHISAKDIERIPIMLPPLELQQSFAAQIEAIEKQKALIRKSIDETRTLLAARMQYYFE